MTRRRSVAVRRSFVRVFRVKSRCLSRSVELPRFVLAEGRLVQASSWESAVLSPGPPDTREYQVWPGIWWAQVKRDRQRCCSLTVRNWYRHVWIISPGALTYDLRASSGTAEIYSDREDATLFSPHVYSIIPRQIDHTTPGILMAPKYGASGVDP